MHYFTVGKKRFVAGLAWSVLKKGPSGRRLRELTGRRRPCVLVRQGELSMAGVAQEPRRAWSVAVAVLPALGRNGYALVRLPDAQWLFLAAVEGMPALQGDVTGDRSTCLRARDRFLAFHDAPVNGWQVTGTPDSPADITGLLPSRLPSSARLFLPGQRLRLFILAAVVAGTAWYVLDYWQTVQRREAQRQAAQSRKQAPGAPRVREVSLPHPWATLPPPAHLLSECLTAVRELPLTLAAWPLNGGECRGDGLRVEYRHQPGSTLAAFREAALTLRPVPVVLVSDDGQHGELRWPLAPAEKADEQPGSQAEQLTPFISGLQARGIAPQLKADPLLRRPTQNVNGEIVRYIQGWQSWSFSVTSARAPDRWFALQPGIRITDITFSVGASSTLTWKTGGQIFAARENVNEK